MSGRKASPRTCSPSPALSACARLAFPVCWLCHSSPRPASCLGGGASEVSGPRPLPGEAEGLQNMCFWEADTSWLGRHLHIYLRPPEPSQDGEEEAVAGQREGGALVS